MDQIKKDARLAGALYLLVTLIGPFTLLYVPGKLFVPGNATLTAANILAHETLFRVFTVAEVVGELLFILTVLALYRLLKHVSQQLAALMAVLILLDAPLAFLSAANHVATLAFLRGADFLAVFDQPQRNALVTLFIELDKQGILVSEMFWGLWLLPLGLLVYRSGFIPRLLGGWLLVNGLAYVTISLTGMLFPQHLKALSTAATPVLFGEVALMLWLLVVGARARPAAVVAPRSS